MLTETSAALPPHTHAAAATPPAHRPRVRRQRAPQPRRGQLLVLPSARTGEGKRLREFRAGLIAHVGGAPSATALALIDRATMLQHHLTTFDRKAAVEGGLSDHARRQYLAFDGSLRRALAQLGLQAAPPSRPSLRDYLDGKGKP